MKMATNFKQFNSTIEFLDFVKNENNYSEAWKTGSENRSSRGTDRVSFSGSLTWESAVHMAQYGWEEGLSQISKEVDLARLNNGQSKEWVNDIAGCLPNVPRFLRNVPDSMQRRVTQNSRKNPIIDFLINVGNRSNINSQAIMNRGIAIASVIDTLEDMGYSIAVNVVSHASGFRGYGNIEVRIPIKEHSQPMDMGTMIFYTAHTSFLRRLIFAYREIICTCGNTSGYGESQDVDRTAKEGIYFPTNQNLNRDCRTVETAMAYVRGIIEAQCPELFERLAA